MPVVTQAPEPIRLDRRRFLSAVSTVLISGRFAADRAAAQAQTVAVAADADKLIKAAEAQIGVTTRYDPAYEPLGFPAGDVPLERGVCTDVVVRAYRSALAADLQALMNADMGAAFSAYPRTWGLARPDPNIDHRRVQNQQVFFKRQGAAHPVPLKADDWQPGDLVTQTLPNGRPHIGVVSATRETASGRLLVIHNIGNGAEKSDTLALYQASGRYRFLV